MPIPNTCRPCRPCRHSLFHGAWWLGRGSRDEPEKTNAEIVVAIEESATPIGGERPDYSEGADRLVSGYLDGRANDRWRLERILADCTADRPTPAKED